MTKKELKKRYHKSCFIDGEPGYFVEQKERLGCLNCHFYNTICDDTACSKRFRTDKKSGIFILAENIID